MKTLLVFLLVVITVSLSYAHNDETLRDNRIAANLRPKRNVKDEVTGHKDFVSLRHTLKSHVSNVAGMLKVKAQELKNANVMAKRSTSKITEVLTEKLQKLKKLKEN